MVNPIQPKKDPRMKPAIEEFSQVYRFWDPLKNMTAVKLQPGDCYVTKENEMLVTVLGSCISACVRDPVAGVGGMNHFMLPKQSIDHTISRSSLSNPELCYGNWAMEHLINSVLKHGGAKNRLEIKIFGGARVLANMSNLKVGERNIEFVKSYLDNDGWAIASQDLGGDYPRKIVYFPTKGNVKMKKMQTETNKQVAVQEESYLDSLSKQSNKQDIELF